ncbi:uncharacterized protein LOC134454007 [Engraulis encrasicolus]|uniref:uncharacterized protein LOC134454007 n=1 Tax=Engraulis encrasicolus TaxID=184585 RepID=UPI002FD00A4D
MEESTKYIEGKPVQDTQLQLALPVPESFPPNKGHFRKWLILHAAKVARCRNRFCLDNIATAVRSLWSIGVQNLIVCIPHWMEEPKLKLPKDHTLLLFKIPKGATDVSFMDALAKMIYGLIITQLGPDTWTESVRRILQFTMTNDKFFIAEDPFGRKSDLTRILTAYPVASQQEVIERMEEIQHTWEELLKMQKKRKDDIVLKKFRNTQQKKLIIDGSNVAMSHGLYTFFSCSGINLAVNDFQKKGHHNIDVHVPNWRMNSKNTVYGTSSYVHNPAFAGEVMVDRDHKGPQQTEPPSAHDGHEDQQEENQLEQNSVPSCASMKSNQSMDKPLRFEGGDAPAGQSPMQLKRPPSPVPSCASMKSDQSMDKPLRFGAGDVPAGQSPKFKGPPSPVPSCVSMKSDQSMEQPLRFGAGDVPAGQSPMQLKRPPSPVPSCVSIKSDRSMEQPLRFGAGDVPAGQSPMQLKRPPSPVPSCVSMKSDQSMEQPLRFGAGDVPAGQSPMQLKRPPSPVPSCVSIKSDRSMDKPLRFGAGDVLAGQRPMQHKRPPSPVPSCVSMKSDKSMDLPVRFEGGDAPAGQSPMQQERPPSPVPSCVSLKSDRSKVSGLNFGGGDVPADQRWAST